MIRGRAVFAPDLIKFPPPLADPARIPSWSGLLPYQHPKKTFGNRP